MRGNLCYTYVYQHVDGHVDGRTRAVAAKIAGVAPSTMGEAMALTREAETSPEAQALVDQVESGEIKVHTAVRALNEGRKPFQLVPTVVSALTNAMRLSEKEKAPRITADDVNAWWAEVNESDWKEAIRAAKWIADNGWIVVDTINSHVDHGHIPPRDEEKRRAG